MLADWLGQIYTVGLILLTCFLQQCNSLQVSKVTAVSQQQKSQRNVPHVARSSHELWYVSPVLIFCFS